ncbi:hypothetical protein HPB48_016031 [Haemaphysalis longicornis]|uniref:Uncharacterized protein n=1 Tax=Haemaphysalis longicornis TaxID=44386 RepID=A0A9J6FZ31_HAELO|nr:hypothetical protein HPB48_016031 [Haemaphysalis longicornis]
MSLSHRSASVVVVTSLHDPEQRGVTAALVRSFAAAWSLSFAMDGGPVSPPQMGLLFKESYIRGRGQDLLVGNLTSAGGRRFLSVAKRATYDKDIYSGVLTGLVRDDLAVQSWRNGAGDKLPADCDTTYTVVHTDLVKLALPERRSITFKTEEDHSKWAVAVDKPFFCIASTNRMVCILDYHRRGEGTCKVLLCHLFARST